MIVCVGVGPGDLAYLTQRGAELIRGADVVAGFDTVVDIVRSLIASGADTVTMRYSDQTEKLAQVVCRHHGGKRCVIVAMGDIHFSGFQFLERIERACGHAVETVPGISSAQMLASRGKVCFDDTTFIGFHRRGDLAPYKRHLVHVLQDDRNAIVIPRPRDFMPRHIASYALANGIASEQPTEVWENLTRAEAAWHGTLRDCTERDFSDLSIMLIRTRYPMPSQIED